MTLSDGGMNFVVIVVMKEIEFEDFKHRAEMLKERAYVPEEFWDALLDDVYVCYVKGDLPHSVGYGLYAMLNRVRNRCQNWYCGKQITLKYVGESYKRSLNVEFVSLDDIDIIDDGIDMEVKGVYEYSVSDEAIVNAILGLCAGKSKLVNRLYRELVPLMNEEDKAFYDGVFARVYELRKKHKKH